jgi:phenylalanyl-tRNA synthetase alpha chain
MVDIKSNINQIRTKIESEIDRADNINKLTSIKNQHLGRKSKLNDVMKNIKSVAPEERAEVGKLANQAKNDLNQSYEKKLQQLKTAEINKEFESESFDPTIPGEHQHKGARHPITQTIDKTIEIFEKMGFEVVTPFEIDDDYHNFTSLNMPEGHPARDAWDTFWTEDNQILITHTSSMQNRIMKSKNPPIRTIVPGKCFRNEATDARHEHTFYQVEGIYVDKGITITDMLGTLKTYFEAYFEKTVQVKFIPDFFPFVEPGGQMALSCVLCDGKGCAVCKRSGWLEILGCGMIHPNVLKEAGIDPDVYTGFAWGFGIERLIMLKNSIEDIRLFHSGDLRFVRQF